MRKGCSKADLLPPPPPGWKRSASKRVRPRIWAPGILDVERVVKVMLCCIDSSMISTLHDAVCSCRSSSARVSPARSGAPKCLKVQRSKGQQGKLQAKILCQLGLKCVEVALDQPGPKQFLLVPFAQQVT